MSPDIQLLHMDCMEYMAGCEDGAFDITVTSPPYDNLRVYGGHGEFTRSLWEQVIGQLYRVTKPGGVVCWVVADQTVDGSETGSSFRQALWAKECGFNLHDTIIWFKDGVRFPQSDRYFDAFEYIFIWSKGKPSHFDPINDRVNKWAGTKLHGTKRMPTGETRDHADVVKGDAEPISEKGKRYNLWRIPNPGIAGNFHPATFPLKLAHNLISSWCPPRGLVFDPFAGSGTTGLAAHIHDCDFVGTEIDEDYYNAAVERFDNETSQGCLLSSAHVEQEPAEQAGLDL